MPAGAGSLRRIVAAERREHLAFLVGEQLLPLGIAAERLGISNQAASKMMKDLELKVFGFNEQVRKRRGR